MDTRVNYHVVVILSRASFEASLWLMGLPCLNKEDLILPEPDILWCHLSVSVYVLNRKPLDVGRQVQHTGLAGEDMVTFLTALAVITQEKKLWAQVERKKGTNPIWRTLGVFLIVNRLLFCRKLKTVSNCENSIKSLLDRELCISRAFFPGTFLGCPMNNI